MSDFKQLYIRKRFVMLIFILSLLSCGSNNPVKSDFSYYQQNFRLTKEFLQPRTDGIYIRTEYAVVDRYPIKDTLKWVYRFFETGEVYKKRYVRENYSHDDLENIARGYYKLNGNNITIESFSPGRKEYWYWNGKISGDTLRIDSVKGKGNKKRGYKAPKKIDEIYTFKKIPNLKNSIVPNW